MDEKQVFQRSNWYFYNSKCLILISFVDIRLEAVKSHHQRQNIYLEYFY